MGKPWKDVYRLLHRWRGFLTPSFPVEPAKTCSQPRG